MYAYVGECVRLKNVQTIPVARRQTHTGEVTEISF